MCLLLKFAFFYFSIIVGNSDCLLCWNFNDSLALPDPSPLCDLYQCEVCGNCLKLGEQLHPNMKQVYNCFCSVYNINNLLNFIIKIKCTNAGNKSG